MSAKYPQTWIVWINTADEQLPKQVMLAILKTAFEAFDVSPFTHSDADTAALGANIQKDFSALQTKDIVIINLHTTVWTASLGF
jgi:hypothetical protein